MLAGEAKQTARRWFHDEWTPALERSGKAGGCHGAYVMGSLAGRSDDEDFDAEASDIDVAVLVDPDVLPPDRERYPHGTFRLFEGCALQTIFVPTPVLDDEETLLGMLGLGCNLLRAYVLSDPDGRIQDAIATLGRRWHEPRWLARRTERAVGFAGRAVGELATTEGPVPRLAALCGAVMQLAGLVPIADGVPPTHRRSLALAAQRLRLRQRDDLALRLLAAIGAADADAADVEAALGDALVALEIEMRYDAATGLSPELRADLPRLLEAGVRELLRDGFPGAAMLPALAGVSTSAASTVGSSLEDAAALDRLASGALRRAGLPPESWESRGEALAQLLDDLVEELTSSS